jgi:hypothetical protein
MTPGPSLFLLTTEPWPNEWRSYGPQLTGVSSPTRWATARVLMVKGDKSATSPLCRRNEVPLYSIQRSIAKMIRPSSTISSIAVAGVVFFFILLGFGTRAVPGLRTPRNHASAGHIYADDVMNSTLGVLTSLFTQVIEANQTNSSRRSSPSVFLPERTIVMPFSSLQSQAASRLTWLMV